jgi:hypothetical protein
VAGVTPYRTLRDTARALPELTQRNDIEPVIEAVRRKPDEAGRPGKT